jgi:hypothetical protein
MPGLCRSINHKLTASAPAFLCVARDDPVCTAAFLRLWTLVAASGSMRGSPRLKSGTVECLKSCLSLRGPVHLPVCAAGPLSAVFGTIHVPHAGPNLSTSVAEEASAFIAELAVHDDWLLAIVRYNCLPPLRELLASGSFDAARTSAAALAALCRHPSTHERMLSSGSVDILLRRAGCRVCSLLDKDTVARLPSQDMVAVTVALCYFPCFSLAVPSPPLAPLRPLSLSCVDTQALTNGCSHQGQLTSCCAEPAVGHAPLVTDAPLLVCLHSTWFQLLGVSFHAPQLWYILLQQVQHPF